MCNSSLVFNLSFLFFPALTFLKQEAEKVAANHGAWIKSLEGAEADPDPAQPTFPNLH